ncbi:hypothetical protein B0O80DRAFT_53280 [Mortierella sp. GBAus27b]|nr:hypothetical protein B0O80DRAFT_53280 [Mortierella sp. GBAus27b]
METRDLLGIMVDSNGKMGKAYSICNVSTVTLNLLPFHGLDRSLSLSLLLSRHLLSHPFILSFSSHETVLCDASYNVLFICFLVRRAFSLQAIPLYTISIVHLSSLLPTPLPFPLTFLYHLFLCLFFSLHQVSCLLPLMICVQHTIECIGYQTRWSIYLSTPFSLSLFLFYTTFTRIYTRLLA